MKSTENGQNGANGQIVVKHAQRNHMVCKLDTERVQVRRL